MCRAKACVHRKHRVMRTQVHKYISHIGHNSFSWGLTTANTATNPATECVSLATPTPRQLRATLYLYTILYTLIHYTIYYTIYYTLYTIHYTLYTIHYTLYTILYTYHLYLYLIPYTLYLYLIPYTLYTLTYTLYLILTYTLYLIHISACWLADPMEADGPHGG